MQLFIHQHNDSLCDRVGVCVLHGKTFSWQVNIRMMVIRGDWYTIVCDGIAIAFDTAKTRLGGTYRTGVNVSELVQILPSSRLHW